MPLPGRSGTNGVTVDDLQRLLHDLVGPVDVFEEVAGRRRREQMRAHFRKQMRRHRHAVRGGERRGAQPAGDAADAFEIGHHVVAALASSAACMPAGSEKFSPIWIGVSSSRTSARRAGVVVVADRLFQPVDVFAIERAAAFSASSSAERLVVVDHQRDVVADAFCAPRARRRGRPPASDSRAGASRRGSRRPAASRLRRRARRGAIRPRPQEL